MTINVTISFEHDYNDIDIPDNYDCEKDPDGIINDLYNCFCDSINEGEIEPTFDIW